MSVLDDEAEDGKIIALQSLSNAQLIQILQHHDGDDDLIIGQAEDRKTRERRWTGVLRNSSYNWREFRE